MKVSSKFAICGLPLRLDTYQFCMFHCEYCFSNNRRRGYSQIDSRPNVDWLRNKFVKVFDDKDVDDTNFVETLLSKGITLHGGGLSDCFQYCEEKYQYTKEIVDLCNSYEQTILFSTKTDTTYNTPITPQYHSFQLSITNTKNIMEEQAPPYLNRVKFYHQLKDNDYKVGIRIQPYLPSVTDINEIIETFNDADHFTIESIKLVNGNPNNKDIMKKLGLRKKDFTQLGLLNIKPSIRLDYYQEIIDLFEDNGLSYSVADNDLHYMGNNDCCCGDELILGNSTRFNNTYLLQRYGKDYTLNDVYDNMIGYGDCKCSSLFNSDRRNGCTNVSEFYLDRFYKSSSPFSPKFQYSLCDGKQTKLI